MRALCRTGRQARRQAGRVASGVLSLLLAAMAVACGGVPATITVSGFDNRPPVARTQARVTLAPTSLPVADGPSPNLTPAPVAGSYQFTEGPAVDTTGSVYFTDVDAGTIYRWSPDGSVAVFLRGLNKPYGLAFDGAGNLIACEGGNGRLISIDSQRRTTVLAGQYNQTRLNEPNDLWIAPSGGIYFTDPAYRSPVVQGGEHVYYLAPDRSRIARVVDDMVKPNGIVGSPDGKTLYVADIGAGRTYAYDINADGALSRKRLIVSYGSDGMDLDASGNVYLTTPGQVRVFDPAGNALFAIRTPEDPTNVAFAGVDSRTLFITARTAVYTVQMPALGGTVVVKPTGFTLTSPEATDGGTLPAEYTCDGASSTLPLAWSGAPAGTQSFAVVMHTVAGPTDIHWYWVLYDIPAGVTSLAKDSAGVGTLGTNSVNRRQEYAPPCSKGPGAKEYTYTVYALSAAPQFAVPASRVDRAVLLDAIRNITLASAELHVTYSRP